MKRSLEIIDDSGLPYRLGPMGTCLEGEYDEVMAVVHRCFERMQRGLRPRRLPDQDRLPPGPMRAAWTARCETVQRKTGRDLAR